MRAGSGATALWRAALRWSRQSDTLRLMMTMMMMMMNSGTQLQQQQQLHASCTRQASPPCQA